MLWFALIVLTAAVVSAEEIWIGTAPFCAGSRNDCTVKGYEYVRSSKTGDGKRCWTGEKVLCRRPEHPRPGIWIGTSPICGGKPSDCAVYDLKYVSSNKRGDGKLCITGTKVLCQAKGEPTEGNKDPKTLNLLTYNIFQRPFIVTHDGQYERTCHIPRAIAQKLSLVDVVIFNEAFLQGCRPEIPMRTLLTFYGFPHSTITVGDDYSGNRGLHFINGGVFIASRWPIVSYSSKIFDAYTTWEADRLALKGVMYAKINKFSQVYHVFGTHLQAQAGAENDRVRIKQSLEIKNFIRSRRISTMEPILLGGDLNADWLNHPAHTQDIVNAIGLKLATKIGEMNATMDPAINDVVEGGEHKEWLDYVGSIKGYAAPRTATMEVKVIKADKSFTYCKSAPMQPHFVEGASVFCKTRHTTKQLSDHFSVLGKFTFN